ncbi:MAG: HAD family hydrolase [Actinomyces sp.]|uniref:HAD family hydrolase n=1 Tax=Actinomyces sp. TaxID=29317 RepID=UPI0026DC688B|nr:HAD family hydrolase [Actinomyces sp.]MDO4243730.1 HAD family hydrolase [Actinomyces sp.]
MSPVSRPRVVLVDVDGTLVTYTNELPDSAVTAIHAARRRGHRVYPATGRSKAEMPQSIAGIGFDGMVCANGAYVEHEGAVVMHRSLGAQDCAALVDWLTGRGLAFYLEANSGLYPSPGFRRAALPAIRAYMAGGDGVAPDLGPQDVDTVLHGLIDTDDLVRTDVNKISYAFSGPADLEAAREAFPHLRHGSWGGRGHEALFGDVGVPGVSKEHALEVLAAHLGTGLEDTVCLGDAAVDIGMLRRSGVGVAMGNASAEVKAAADFVTGAVEDDGLAMAFGRLGLIDPAQR